MEPRASENQDVFRHLFILETPVHDALNLNQYWALQLADVLRNRVKIYPNAPHGYYLVDDDRSEGKEEVFAFFQGDDVFQALQDLRQARQPESPGNVVEMDLQDRTKAPSTTQTPPSPEHRVRPGRGRLQGSQPYGSTSHAHIPSSGSPRFGSTSSSASTPLVYIPPAGASTDISRLISRITNIDRNTLIPLDQAEHPARTLDNCLYTMKIELEHSLRDIGVNAETYILTIDTASAIIWFYGSDFLRLIRDEEESKNQEGVAGDDNGTTIRMHDSDVRDVHDHPFEDDSTDNEDVDSVESNDNDEDMYSDESSDNVPPGWKTVHWDGEGGGKPTVPRYRAECDLTELDFFDSGKVLLERYPLGHEIQALVPSWDWKSQQRTTTKLPLPRVLAYAANDYIVDQPSHGNLGLAIPGSTTPYDSTHPSTFFEAISRTPGRWGKHVDEPKRMTLRLLHPQVIAFGCPKDVQSYLYHGIFWPCAIMDDAAGSTDRWRVPSFTPKILVFPTYSRVLENGLAQLIYDMWMVRLVSMALLVPRLPRPNRTAQVPCRDSMDDWIPITIEMPATRHSLAAAQQDTSEPEIGLPVVLDTCSSVSILPQTVCEAIATQWLGLPPPTLGSGQSVLYCPDTLDLDDHDILFTFIGEGGSTVDFRCTASRFLRSTWNEPHANRSRVPILARPADTDPAVWILGQNFFWTAFVQLNCSFRGKQAVVAPDTDVHVRLAPQRAKDAEGRYWMDEKSIRFHKLPGRLEAERLQAAGLRYDD